MTRKKNNDARAVSMYAPIGGVLTVDQGIVKGELLWSLESDSATNGTNVFVRYRGDEQQMMLQGSPLAGTITIEQVRDRLRSMTVSRDANGVIQPFSF